MTLTAAASPATVPRLLWAVVAAFGTYFCMYGFRKPFTAAGFDGYSVNGVGLKVVLVTAQVFGYMLSKFVGIRVVAELSPARRARAILVMVGASWLALVGFGLTPPPFNAVFLFLNGLPLGMVFGLVLGFLEGRRATEALTAGLCASFILADGVTKSVGAYLIDAGVSEFHMPAAAGVVFAGPLCLFVWMLSSVTPPTADDVVARAERSPMTAHERRSLLYRHGIGLGLLTFAYLLITVLRSLRADFAPQIWQGLGVGKQPEVFTTSETWVALGVTALNGAAVLIADNRAAFRFALGLSVAGLFTLLASLYALSAGLLSSFAFMVVVGLGLYVPYVAVHTTIFERFIAVTRERGNIGFLLTFADAFGYLGYVAVMLASNFVAKPGDMLGFFVACGWVVGIIGIVCLAAASVAFGLRPSPTVAVTETT